MGKIHELIAVEEDAQKKMQKIFDETHATFTKRIDHFDAHSRVYSAFDASDRDIPEEETTHLVTTVSDKLAYTIPYAVKYLDILLQKESANTQAKADLVVETNTGEDKILQKDVPVIVLVQFQKILTEMRKHVFASIPTLDPKIDWEVDGTQKNTWKQKTPRKVVRTRKEPQPITLAPATDKHQAQAQLVNKDVPVGEYTISQQSSRLSPAQKSDLLDKLDRVIEGVKRARSRANNLDAPKKKIGKAIFDFITN